MAENIARDDEFDINLAEPVIVQKDRKDLGKLNARRSTTTVITFMECLPLYVGYQNMDVSWLNDHVQ